MQKPFKIPLLKQQNSTELSERQSSDESRVGKKRRLSPGVEDVPIPRSEVTYSTVPNHIATPVRRPLLTLPGRVAALVVKPLPEVEANEAALHQDAYYDVLWRRFTNKKHKTWDGDGMMSVVGGYAHLYDVSGREMGRVACSKPLLPGSLLSISGKDVEVNTILSRDDYISRRQDSGRDKGVGVAVREVDQRLQTNVKFNAKPNDGGNKPSSQSTKPLASASQRLSSSTSQEASKPMKQFRPPVLNATMVPKQPGDIPTPRHDPNAPDALVMKRPTSILHGKHVVDVVVDPILTKRLRQHQREGVKFMYECIMGMQPHNGQGAILADEMGLGKTLQVITLLWTLMKQGPIYEDGPIIRKALIVCPATLTKNWRKEFRKWLGSERVGVFDADDKRAKLSHFTNGRSYNVMIIGYERLRGVHDELQKGAGVDIVIADEGHRLKSAQNKSAQAIKSLNTERRIILSGTPLQNDLSEFFFAADFVNPGILGKLSKFKKNFEGPILKSRQPEASLDDIDEGREKSGELAEITRQFMLRRTAEILSQYLPPKTEYVLLCKPTSTQAAVYRNVLASPNFGSVLGSRDAMLQLITVLKKLCNSPSLLKVKDDVDEIKSSVVNNLLSTIQPPLLSSPGASGKLQVLDQLLHIIRTTTQEKVVLVSHYTSTLDVLANLLTSLSYTWLRLDGSTPKSKRQGLVDKFNNSDATTCFAFLFSAKTGGTGINLIGASRLILFDLDWNPSTDLQAMARVHRDGQKRPCKIYRLITQGGLDEKIYQRQLTKLSLADSIVDNKSSVSTFTLEELRDLFTLDETSRCQTHDLLKCKCQGRGEAIIPADVPPDTTPLLDAAESVDGHSDENDNLPELSAVFNGLVRASDVDMEAQERSLRAARAGQNQDKLKVLALMQYLHLDTASVDEDDEEMEAMVDDDVLYSVLRNGEGRVQFVFTKSSVPRSSAGGNDSADDDDEVEDV